MPLEAINKELSRHESNSQQATIMELNSQPAKPDVELPLKSADIRATNIAIPLGAGSCLLHTAALQKTI